MEKKYITDTDFLPQELTHYHGGYSDEMNDGLYQIVFRIFLSAGNLNHIYDQVIRIARGEGNATIRKFKLLSWKGSLEDIRKMLAKCKSKEYDVIVYIPYVGCLLSLATVESHIKLVIFTIDELLNSNPIPKPLFPDQPPVPDIKSLFESSYEDIYESLDEGKPSSDGLLERTRYNHLIIQDEMYRRGIESIRHKGKSFRIQPSKFYGNNQLYKQLFIDNGLQHQQNAESLLPNASELPSASDNDSIQTRAAVMYFMLNSFCRVTDENFNRAVALIDFAVGKQSPKFNVNKANDTEINKVNNKNSIKKYVRTFRDNPHYLDEPNSDKVRARLTEQGFDISSPDSTKHT